MFLFSGKNTYAYFPYSFWENEFCLATIEAMCFSVRIASVIRTFLFMHQFIIYTSSTNELFTLFKMYGIILLTQERPMKMNNTILLKNFTRKNIKKPNLFQKNETILVDGAMN